MIVLRPLTDGDLALVEPWFDDAETRHWLGGAGWPKGKLAIAGPSRHTLLGLDDGTPFGLIDVEIGPERRAAFAIVVAPALRGRGLGTTMVAALTAHAGFADVSEWFAGVETGNLASRQLLLGCRFARMTDEDADGFSYYALRRRGWPRLPW